MSKTNPGKRNQRDQRKAYSTAYVRNLAQKLKGNRNGESKVKSGH